MQNRGVNSRLNNIQLAKPDRYLFLSQSSRLWSFFITLEPLSLQAYSIFLILYLN